MAAHGIDEALGWFSGASRADLSGLAGAANVAGPASSYALFSQYSCALHRRVLSWRYGSTQPRDSFAVTNGYHGSMWMTDFRCHVRVGLFDGTREAYRNVCEGLPFYNEEGRWQYCVLHCPNSVKWFDIQGLELFAQAINNKRQKGDFDFSGVDFPSQYRDFGSTEFNSDVCFREAIFHGAPYFTKSTFMKAADFLGAKFHSGADFSEAIFKGSANFQAAEFLGGVGAFWSTIFERDVNFVATQFRLGAHFWSTIFEKEVDFSKASFYPGAGHWSDQGASFSGTTFAGQVSFAGATFKQETRFEETTFQAGARFHGHGNPRMYGPGRTISLFDFRAGVTFDRAWIEKPELFFFQSGHLRPSWFVGLDGIQKMNFANVEWYGVTRSINEHTLEDEIDAVNHPHEPTRYRLLADTCRQLSLNAEQNRDYSSAGEFHYWEMDATRKGNWSFFRNVGPKVFLEKESLRNFWKHFGIITTLYWALSGYGERPKRAFWVLIGLCAAFAVLYMLLGPNPLQVLSASTFGQAMEHGGQAVVYSLSTMARLNPEPKPNPGLLQFLVTVEGILGPLQIALLVLAIRRKVMR
jgi:uncharacterized protein YjbI with pentapeptide repeats